MSIGVWLWAPAQPQVPSGALFVVEGRPYGENDIEGILGTKPRFASLGEAEDAVRSIADQLILQHEADRRYAAGQRVSADDVLARIVSEAKPRPEPTEDEVEAYYEAHRDQYVGTREVSFDMVTVQKADAPEEAKRQVEALRVRAEMNLELSRDRQVAIRRPDGAHWIEVVALPCDEGESAEFPPAEVRRAACALSIGLVSRPIETPKNWHLVRVTAQRPARNTPLARAAAEIRSLLAEQASNARWTESLAKLRDDAKVVVSRSALLQLVESDNEDLPTADQEAPSRPPMPPGSGGRSS